MDRGQIDQLEKLASLKEKGILTEEEFNKKKAQLLLAVRQVAQAVPQPPPTAVREGTYWLPIPSLVLGIISLPLFDENPMNKDVMLGTFLFSVTAFVLGVVSLSQQAKGKGMAIAGIILSSISLLILAGMQL